jgi:hypothetical protein
VTEDGRRRGREWGGRGAVIRVEKHGKAEGQKVGMQRVTKKRIKQILVLLGRRNKTRDQKVKSSGRKLRGRRTGHLSG